MPVEQDLAERATAAFMPVTPGGVQEQGTLFVRHSVSVVVTENTVRVVPSPTDFATKFGYGYRVCF